MRLPSIAALFALASVACAEAKLQIEVTKAVPAEQCTQKTEAGDFIEVHYTGKLLDGTVFDSSLDRGTPISFKVGTGRVIQGWDQGLLDMCVGEQRTLTIPSHLGYGARGAGRVIPPNADLVFTTELVKIVKKDEL